MDFQLEFRDRRLCASGDMNIYSATAMSQQLQEQIAAGMTVPGNELLLDLADVTEMDTCGLQIVLLAGKLAASEGRSLKVVAASPAAREVLALCGLDRLHGHATGKAA